jgi:hypothetical protein
LASPDDCIEFEITNPCELHDITSELWMHPMLRINVY